MPSVARQGPASACSRRVPALHAYAFSDFSIEKTFSSSMHAHARLQVRANKARRVVLLRARGARLKLPALKTLTA